MAGLALRRVAVTNDRWTDTGIYKSAIILLGAVTRVRLHETFRKARA